jgi:hypothetical protein
MRGPLTLEALEERALLSVTAVLSGTALSLTGDEGTSHTVLVRQTANTLGSFDVVADGVTTSFTGLTQVNYQGSNQGNTFTNRVSTLPGLINVGNGYNIVYTIAKGSTVLAGNGSNILQVTGGNSTITVGNGNNNVYGGPGDTITIGNGQNIVYDILPGNTSVSVGQHGTQVDHLFIGPQTVLSGAQAQDHVAQFFVAAPLGSGTFAQVGGTLYFAANNNGDTVSFYPLGPDSVLAFYNLNDGTGYQFAFFFGVNQIAAFGGTGNDSFTNNTSIDDAMYGAGGSNVLVGGYGQLDLEKAGGQAATGSIAVGRSPEYNDLNGSGLTATTNTLIFTNPAAHNIARTNSPTDVVLGANVLVSLYPDLVTALYLPPVVPA